jgi:hypothetical protein
VEEIVPGLVFERLEEVITYGVREETQRLQDDTATQAFKDEFCLETVKKSLERLQTHFSMFTGNTRPCSSPVLEHDHLTPVLGIDWL